MAGSSGRRAGRLLGVELACLKCLLVVGNALPILGVCGAHDDFGDYLARLSFGDGRVDDFDSRPGVDDCFAHCHCECDKGRLLTLIRWLRV